MAGFILFDPDDESIGFSTGTNVGTGVYLDIENDVLYYTDRSTIFKWDDDDTAPATYTWRSGDLLLRAPANLGAGLIEADAYPITFKLYADSVLRATRIVIDDNPFRLPGGYMSASYQVEVTGTGRLREIKVAETVYELSEG